MFLNKRNTTFIVLLLLSFKIFCNDENPKILSFNNIFLDGAVQRYIAVQELQDYTMIVPDGFYPNYLNSIYDFIWS